MIWAKHDVILFTLISELTEIKLTENNSPTCRTKIVTRISIKKATFGIQRNKYGINLCPS